MDNQGQAHALRSRNELFHIITVHSLRKPVTSSVPDPDTDDENTNSAALRDFITSRYGQDRTTDCPCRVDFRSDNPAKELESAGRLLLDALIDRTQLSNDHKPFVLVGQGLGGIIIKQALLTAVYDHQYDSLAKWPFLLVFIRTPQTPTDIESWVAKFIVGELSAIGGSSQPFYATLAQFSRALIGISMRFPQVSRLYPRISFTEQPTASLSSTLESSKAAIMMDSPGEVIRSIDPQQSDLEKCLERAGSFTDLIAKEIKKVKGIDPEYLECFRTLSKIDSDYARISPQCSDPALISASAETLNWTLNHAEYKKWINGESSSRLLWLHGWTASDIISSSAGLEARVLEAFPKARVIRYAFDEQNSHSRTSFAMFASLSRQLLMMDPSLFSHIQLPYQTFHDERPWLVGYLWIILRSLLTCPEHGGNGGQTICFLTRFDDRDPLRSSFIRQFLRLGGTQSSLPRLRIVVISCAAPDAQLLQRSPKLSGKTADRLDFDAIQLDINSGDLNEFHPQRPVAVLRSAFAELYRTQPKLSQHKTLIMKSLKRFTDVQSTSIALDLLGGQWTRRSTAAEIKAALKFIPGSLTGLYRHFLDMIPPAESEWAAWVLSWVARAYRPLTLSELAVAIALQKDSPSLSTLLGKRPVDIESDLGQVFGNLIRVQGQDVVLVDPSLRDYLLNGPEPDDQKIGASSISSDDLLADACLRYFWVKSENGGKDSGTELGNEAGSADQSSHSSLCEGSDEDQSEKPDDHEPFPYAFLHWTTHYNQAIREQQQKEDAENEHLRLRERASEAFTDRQRVNSWLPQYKILANPFRALPVLDVYYTEPLCLATRFDCRDIVSSLIKDLDVTAKMSQQRLECALELAIETGNDEIARELRQKHASSPRELELVAKYGHDKLGGVILTGKSGSDPDSQSPPGDTPKSRASTPLHFAAAAGYDGLVRKLLNTGFGREAKDEAGKTPIHLASQYGHTEVLEILLEHSPNMKLTEKDDDGRSPLHVACEWQQPGSVTALLASNSVKSDERDGRNQTPLEIACETGRADIVKILLDYWEAAAAQGLQQEVSATEGVEGVHDATMGDSVDPPQSAVLSTPLHLAARGGHQLVVREILSKASSSNPSARIMNLSIMTIGDESNNTPLHLAIQHGHLGVVRELMITEKKNNIRRNHKSALCSKNKLYQAPIHVAVLSGDSQMVQEICDGHRRLKKTMDVFDRDSNSPLHLAAQHGFSDIADLLLYHDAQVDIANNDAKTPLLLACENGQVEISHLLLQYGADPMSTDRVGRSALHHAASSGSTALVRSLLEMISNLGYPDPGRYVGSRDSNGSTPIHLAAESGKVDMMGALLEMHPDLESPDGKGRSPIFLASKGAHADMVDFLFEELKEKRSDSSTEAPLIKILLDAQPDWKTKYGDQTPPGKSRHILNRLLEGRLSGDAAEYAPLLIVAAAKGIMVVVDKILDEIPGIDTNCLDDSDRTPLILAAKNGHEAVVDTLLKNNDVVKNCYYRDSLERSALVYAAMNGDLEIVTKLVQLSRPDLPSYRGALIEAAKEGHDGIVRELMQKPPQADVGSSDSFQREGEVESAALTSPENTALLEAVRRGRKEVVSLLLEKGCDPNTTTGSEEGGRTTLLHFAVQLYDDSICRSLLESREHKISDETLNAINPEKHTALFAAAWSGKVTMAQLLLDHGADTEIADAYGQRPLHGAYDSPDIVGRILACGRAVVESRDKGGKTPLLRAIESGYAETARILIEHGADPFARDKWGMTPLEAAASSSNVTFLGEILDRAAEKCRASAKNDANEDSPASTSGQMTSHLLPWERLLSAAALSGQSNAVEYLLSRDEFLVDINNTSTTNGSEAPSPLWSAFRSGKADIVRKIVESPKLEAANFSWLNSEPEELLKIWASNHRREGETVAVLFERGLHKKCGPGTLWDLAEHTGTPILVEHLKEEATDDHGWPVEWIRYMHTEARDRNISDAGELWRTTKGEPAFQAPSDWTVRSAPGMITVAGPAEGGDGSKVLSFQGEPTTRMTTVCVARGNHPIPPVGDFMLEVTVLEQHERKDKKVEIAIGVGLICQPFDRLPGLEGDSWGYHGDTGRCYEEGMSLGGSGYRAPFGEGDTIRCHVNPNKGAVRYMNNGIELGTAWEGITGRLYPLIGIRSGCAKLLTRFEWKWTPPLPPQIPTRALSNLLDQDIGDFRRQRRARRDTRSGIDHGDRVIITDREPWDSDDSLDDDRRRYARRMLRRYRRDDERGGDRYADLLDSSDDSVGIRTRNL